MSGTTLSLPRHNFHNVLKMQVVGLSWAKRPRVEWNFSRRFEVRAEPRIEIGDGRSNYPLYQTAYKTNHQAQIVLGRLRAISNYPPYNNFEPKSTEAGPIES